MPAPLLSDFFCIEYLASAPVWEKKLEVILGRYQKGCRVYLTVKSEDQLTLICQRLRLLLKDARLPVLALSGRVHAFHFEAICRDATTPETLEHFERDIEFMRCLQDKRDYPHSDTTFFLIKALFLCHHEDVDPTHIDLVAPTLLTVAYFQDALRLEYHRLYKLTHNPAFDELSRNFGGMTLCDIDTYVGLLVHRFYSCLGASAGMVQPDGLTLLRMIRREIDAFTMHRPALHFKEGGHAQNIYQLLLRLASLHIDPFALKRELFGQSTEPELHEWLCGVLIKISSDLAADPTAPAPLLHSHLRNLLCDNRLAGDTHRYLLLYAEDMMGPVDREIFRNLKPIYSVFTQHLSPDTNSTLSQPNTPHSVSIRSVQERYPAVLNLIHLLQGSIALITRTQAESQILARDIPGCTLLVSDHPLCSRAVSDVYCLLYMIVYRNPESMANFCSTPYCEEHVAPAALYHASATFLSGKVPEKLLLIDWAEQPAIRIVEYASTLLKPWERVDDTENYHAQLDAFIKYLNTRYPFTLAPELLDVIEHNLEAPVPCPHALSISGDICCGTIEQLRGMVFDYVILPFASDPVLQDGIDAILSNGQIGYRIPIGGTRFLQNSVYSAKNLQKREHNRLKVAVACARKALFYIDLPNDTPLQWAKLLKDTPFQHF